MSKERTLRAPSAKILVVDDNDFYLKTVEALLGMMDIRARLAYSGAEAIELIQKEDFDMVFMDHMMPEMDGIEATRAIRKLGDKYSRVVIIALTANTVQGAKEMFLSQGFNGFVSKPVQIRELKEILIEWLPKEKIKLNAQGSGGPESIFSPELRRKLIKNFIKDNKDRFNEIEEAISSGGIGLANRLAHTLKGNAGQLGKTSLQQAAAVLERQLADAKNPVTPEQMLALKTELNAALSQFTAELEAQPSAESDTPVNGSSAPETEEWLDAKSAGELFEKLEPLLEMGNPECRGLVSKLRLIHDGGDGLKTGELKTHLMQQIDDFDFELALVTLGELKKQVMQADGMLPGKV